MVPVRRKNPLHVRYTAIAEIMVDVQGDVKMIRRGVPKQPFQAAPDTAVPDSFLSKIQISRGDEHFLHSSVVTGDGLMRVIVKDELPSERRGFVFPAVVCVNRNICSSQLPYSGRELPKESPR